MSNSPYFDQIEAYIEGKLPKEERIRFEGALKKDKELEAEVQIQRDIVSTLRNQDVFVFKEQLGAFAKDRVKENIAAGKKANPIKWIYLVLAVVFSIVILFLYDIYNPDKQKPEGESITVLEEYALDPSSNMCKDKPRAARNNDPQLDTDELCGRIKSMFQSGNYEMAVSHLDDLIAQTSDTVYWTYFKGYCFLQLEKLDASIQSYQYCIDPSHNLSRDKTRNSHYYISLAYYLRGQVDDPQNVKNNLEEFIKKINPNSILFDKTEELLKEFNEANPVQ